MKNNRFLMFIFLLSCLISNSLNGQNRIDSKFILNKVYPFISEISNGPLINAEVKPGTPNKNGEYSYYFRCVVVEHETWDLLYAERISVKDEEGLERELAFSKTVPLDSLFPSIEPLEYRNLNDFHWKKDNTISFQIKNKEVSLNIKEILIPE